jgi:hypothetical protein
MQCLEGCAMRTVLPYALAWIVVACGSSGERPQPLRVATPDIDGSGGTRGLGGGGTSSAGSGGTAADAAPDSAKADASPVVDAGANDASDASALPRCVSGDQGYERGTCWCPPEDTILYGLIETCPDAQFWCPQGEYLVCLPGAGRFGDPCNAADGGSACERLEQDIHFQAVDAGLTTQMHSECRNAAAGEWRCGFRCEQRGELVTDVGRAVCARFGRSCSPLDANLQSWCE